MQGAQAVFDIYLTYLLTPTSLRSIDDGGSGVIQYDVLLLPIMLWRAHFERILSILIAASGRRRWRRTAVLSVRAWYYSCSMVCMACREW